LGRDFDAGLVSELEDCGNADICGERGEYHTFAFGGPLFHTPLDLRNSSSFEREDHLILDIEARPPTQKE
jgi:diphthine-ammonia ligase